MNDGYCITCKMYYDVIDKGKHTLHQKSLENMSKDKFQIRSACSNCFNQFTTTYNTSPYCASCYTKLGV